MMFKGEEVTEEQVFRVAANSFLAEGGDNFTTFGKGTNVADSGQIDLVAAVEYFKAHPMVDPAPLGRAVVAGTDWAKVALEATTVKQGETLKAEVSGLEEGAQVTAVLHSDPIEAIDIPAANAEGATAFEIAIPADFETGAHTLVVSARPRRHRARCRGLAVTAPAKAPPRAKPRCKTPRNRNKVKVRPLSHRRPTAVTTSRRCSTQAKRRAGQHRRHRWRDRRCRPLLAAVGGFLLWRRHRMATTDAE